VPARGRPVPDKVGHRVSNPLGLAGDPVRRRRAVQRRLVKDMEGMRMSERRIVHRVCPFCEATCGLNVEVEGDRVVMVRGDKEDPFSQGFLCPKAYGVKELYHNPDRLQRPLRRTASGWEEIGWDEAYYEVGARLPAIRENHGNDAINFYSGNPVVHDLGALTYRPVLQRALASRSIFNSSAIDTLPKIVQIGLMFGRHCCWQVN
jgi:anaerobic selenocysteine-containing dehydrogenase